MHRVLSTFTCYANYHLPSITKNEQSKIQFLILSKMSKLFFFYITYNSLVEDINPFTSYAKYHSTANNAEVVSKNTILQKLDPKFVLNTSLKILMHFLVEHATSFHLICNYIPLLIMEK